ncbi:MAG: rhodanese-like domain-containing protein [Flavobacteriales bacterium]|nr:rhodanese-like domain-containing protein [Flavobacteriales bacterium]
MKEITPAELHKWREEGVAHQLIDIREEHEVITGNIGGTHIPMAEVINRRAELKSDMPVVIHCRSGKRSSALVYALEQKFHLPNLYSLKGGILAWAKEVDPGVAVN